MTHYRMLDRAPSCAILHNRNELKLYQGNLVYLNDGDNFELRFFNPLPEKIGVEINFNGMKKGDGYLVLNPGQDLVLDRFLDEQRKMLFETYVVDGNNEAAVKAIEENGVITFNFYKEKNSYRNYQNEVKVNYNFPPKPIHYPNYTTTTTTTYYGTSGWSGSSGTSGSSGISGCSGYAGPFGSPGVQGPCGPSGTIGSNNLGQNLHPVGGGGTSTSSIPFSKDYWFPTSDGTTPVMDSFSHDAFLASSIGDYSDYLAENTDNNIAYSEYIQNPLETGRIEKGDISNQKLKGVNLQFNATAFHSVTYKLMPISSMNRTIGEVRQYCGKCGYRLRKSSWEFCPHCGEKIM